MNELRSDEQLRLAVLDALEGNESLVGMNFRVGVLNAVAHLAGSAPTVSIWELAGEIAAGVPGVRGVVNRIDAPGAPSPSRIINLNSHPGSS
jgi:osmotically-inducible protein OsmY